MKHTTVGRKTFSIIQIDGTKYVCLPREFVTSHGIKKGDKIEALFDGSIVYRPIKNDEIEKEIAEANNEVEALINEGRRNQHLLPQKIIKKAGVARLASNATPAPESTAPSGSKRGNSNE
jgi:hypothetical protein